MTGPDWFVPIWFVFFLYMYTVGAWKGFGAEHPRIGIFIIVFGGIIVRLLLE